MRATFRQDVFGYCLKLGLALVLMSHLYIYAQSSCPHEEGASFQLGAGNFALIPNGRFLLIRRDGHIGAIRILSSHHDDAPPPRFSEWIGTVVYESFYSEDPTLLHSASQRLGQITFGRIKGVGFHYSWQSRTGKTVVGPWHLRIDGPHEIMIGKYVDDKRYEFAATSACSLATIPPVNELQWFHYDRSTQHKFLVSDLPGDM